MDVHIDEITSNVRTTDSQTLFTARNMNAIVRAVQEALADESRREHQASAERRITASSMEHLEED